MFDKTQLLYLQGLILEVLGDLSNDEGKSFRGVTQATVYREQLGSVGVKGLLNTIEFLLDAQERRLKEADLRADTARDLLRSYADHSILRPPDKETWERLFENQWQPISVGLDLAKGGDKSYAPSIDLQALHAAERQHIAEKVAKAIDDDITRTFLQEPTYAV